MALPFVSARWPQPSRTVSTIGFGRFAIGRQDTCRRKFLPRGQEATTGRYSRNRWSTVWSYSPLGAVGLGCNSDTVSPAGTVPVFGFSRPAASVRRASGRGSGRMLRNWGGWLGRYGGKIFAEFEPEPFSGQVLIVAGLVLHNGAQTFQMVAESEVVRAEPEGVGKSDPVRAGAAKGLRAKGILDDNGGSAFFSAAGDRQ